MGTTPVTNAIHRGYVPFGILCYSLVIQQWLISCCKVRMRPSRKLDAAAFAVAVALTRFISGAGSLTIWTR
jgi:hypothetical protein